MYVKEKESDSEIETQTTNRGARDESAVHEEALNMGLPSASLSNTTCSEDYSLECSVFVFKCLCSLVQSHWKTDFLCSLACNRHQSQA